MIIRNEKEYKQYEARVEELIERGTILGDMELLSEEDKAEFSMLSDAQWEKLLSSAPCPIAAMSGYSFAVYVYIHG